MLASRGQRAHSAPEVHSESGLSEVRPPFEIDRLAKSGVNLVAELRTEALGFRV